MMVTKLKQFWCGFWTGHYGTLERQVPGGFVTNSWFWCKGCGKRQFL